MTELVDVGLRSGTQWDYVVGLSGTQWDYVVGLSCWNSWNYHLAMASEPIWSADND